MGIFGFRSTRTSLYVGAGITILPLVGLTGAIVGLNLFDDRLYGGRVRANLRFSPQGDLRPGIEYLVGLRWQPSAVLRSPYPDRFAAGDLNSNSLLAEMGIGKTLVRSRGGVASTAMGKPAIVDCETPSAR